MAARRRATRSRSQAARPTTGRVPGCFPYGPAVARRPARLG